MRKRESIVDGFAEQLGVLVDGALKPGLTTEQFAEVDVLVC